MKNLRLIIIENILMLHFFKLSHGVKLQEFLYSHITTSNSNNKFSIKHSHTNLLRTKGIRTLSNTNCFLSGMNWVNINNLDRLCLFDRVMRFGFRRGYFDYLWMILNWFMDAFYLFNNNYLFLLWFRNLFFRFRFRFRFFFMDWGLRLSFRL